MANQHVTPPFIFRIDEFTEDPALPEKVDAQGVWLPVTLPNYNRRVAGGVSGSWWECDGSTIRPLANFAPVTKSYKTFSTIYSGGRGFHILQGDAESPPRAEAWHPLWFEHNQRDYSSSLTNAGTQSTLRVHNPSLTWHSMLLPNIYHGPRYPHLGYGGLTGDLPILLSLLALSMQPADLPHYLPSLMQMGRWVPHNRPCGWNDKRGVIVYVYAVNNNDSQLRAYEEGSYGKYYD